MNNRTFVIVGAGDFDPGELTSLTKENYFLCAADAGFLLLQSADIVPDLLIGDFDSMKEPLDVKNRITLPIEKDDTDISFCIKEGFRRGFRRFLIFGGLGGKRISHSFANIQLLSMIHRMGGSGELISEGTRMLLGHSGETFSFSEEEDTAFSVFSLSEESTVSLTGLYYPLSQGVLTRHFPLGVSNHFTEEKATVTIHDGEVLMVIESL